MLHIKVVKIETGEVLADAKTNCIIGAFGTGENGENGMVYLNNCNALEATATLFAAKSAIENVRNNHTKVALLEKLVERKKETEGI